MIKTEGIIEGITNEVTPGRSPILVVPKNNDQIRVFVV